MADYLINRPFCSDDFTKSSEVRKAGDRPNIVLSISSMGEIVYKWFKDEIKLKTCRWSGSIKLTPIKRSYPAKSKQGSSKIENCARIHWPNGVAKKPIPLGHETSFVCISVY